MAKENELKEKDGYKPSAPVDCYDPRMAGDIGKFWWSLADDERIRIEQAGSFIIFKMGWICGVQFEKGRSGS